MKDKVITIISSTTGIAKENITENANLLTDLELESLDVVTLVAELEKEVGKEIPDKDIKEFQTVGDVIKYLEDNAWYIYLWEFKFSRSFRKEFKELSYW